MSAIDDTRGLNGENSCVGVKFVRGVQDVCARLKGRAKQR
jgi:hypothetical protein